jgi:hypothetical protein
MSNSIVIAGSRLTSLSDLPNLGQRMRFFDASTMDRSVGGGGGNPGNGDPVGRVIDTWGGYDMEATSGAVRPTFETGVHAGFSAVRFNGTSHLLRSIVTNNLTANRAAITFYAVVRWAAVPTGRQTVFMSAAEDALNNQTVRFEHGASPASPGFVRVAGRRLLADSAQILNGSIGLDTNMALLTATLDWQNTTARFWRQDVLDAQSTSFGTAGNSANTNTPVWIGGLPAFSAYFNGWMFETALFHAAHTAPQRRAIWNYFRRKYQF